MTDKRISMRGEVDTSDLFGEKLRLGSVAINKIVIRFDPFMTDLWGSITFITENHAAISTSFTFTRQEVEDSDDGEINVDVDEPVET
jgi:hypothetical protein